MRAVWYWFADSSTGSPPSYIRFRAVQSVNTHLIELYWQVGALISRKLTFAEWGVAQLADYLARTQPGLRGFTRSNLFKMRQFYDLYQGDIKVATLWRL